MSVDSTPHSVLPLFFDCRDGRHGATGSVLFASSYVFTHPDPDMLMVFADIGIYAQAHPCHATNTALDSDIVEELCLGTKLCNCNPLEAGSPEILDEKRPCPNCGATDWTYLAGKREGEYGQFGRVTNCNRCPERDPASRQDG